MKEQLEENFIFKEKNRNITNNLYKNMFSDLSISYDPIPPLIEFSKNIEKNILAKISINSNSNIIPNEQIKLNEIISQNIQKYNSIPEENNINIIDNIINLKENHLVSVFKDNLIYCNDNEFLKGNFNIKECIEVLPKFYEYYKNYLKFFLKPTFNNFYINEAIQEYGENQAEVFYNNNYVNKKQRDKKENIDDQKIEDNESNKNSNSYNNETSFMSYRTFFTNSVESMIREGIDNMNKKEDNDKELSNIKQKPSKENTIYLPDNSSVSIEDIITKKNSIKNIIDLMKNKNINKMQNKKLNLSNQKESKKKCIIIVDKKKLIENKNLFNRKRFNSFSKTTLNIYDKNQSIKKVNNIIMNKEHKKANKKIAIKSNENNNNIKKNKVLPNSIYSKCINKINLPKIKIPRNELILTSSNNNNNNNNSSNNNNPKIKKNLNKIYPINTNENTFNFHLTKNNYNLKNSKSKNNILNNSNNNKIYVPLKIKNFYNKIRNLNNSNSSYQLSICKTTNNRNNSTAKIGKTKNIINKTNYNFNKNNSNHIKKLTVLPLLSPKSKKNFTRNKSYSTINNCNININNNIFLSNNYIYNNKYLLFHNSQSQSSIQNNKSKDKNNQKKIKPLTSRNIKIDLDKFKTEENYVNSLISQGTSNKIIKNKNDIKQYTSFRKNSNNNNNNINNNKENINNQRNLFKVKKLNITTRNKNLVLKDVLTMNRTKNNLNKMNKVDDYNSITKSYKNLYIKSSRNKTNNSSNEQKMIIFDYKKK